LFLNVKYWPRFLRSYTGSSIVADVSYDMFTSSTASGSNEYEIMIWLAAIGGAGPISSNGSAVATPTIGGVNFKLYSGPNGATTVYSFVAASETTSFSGDLKAFYTYLESSSSFSFPSSQYLLDIGAGSEPFTGSGAVFKTSAYSCVVNWKWGSEISIEEAKGEWFGKFCLSLHVNIGSKRILELSLLFTCSSQTTITVKWKLFSRAPQKHTPSWGDHWWTVPSADVLKAPAFLLPVICAQAKSLV
jgi:Glycosyl hydrolase family 12